MPFQPLSLEGYVNQWKKSYDANVNVIIVKVCKIALVIMNVDDETNEDEYDNDFQGGRWCRQWKLHGKQWKGPWRQRWWWWGQVGGVNT